MGRLTSNAWTIRDKLLDSPKEAELCWSGSPPGAVRAFWRRKTNQEKTEKGLERLKEVEVREQGVQTPLNQDEFDHLISRGHN